MHDPYDEDDGYDDDYYDKDYNDQYDPYKFYFKFNVDKNTPLSEWITKMINDIMKNPIEDNYNITNIPGFPVYVFPVNSWNPITGKDNSFQYLGSNYHKEPIWKTKYFIQDKINTEYKLHLQSHAKHFIGQPNFYKGLYDILN